MLKPGRTLLPTAWKAKCGAVRSLRSALTRPAGQRLARPAPAVVVSNDAASATATRLGQGVITVVPVTSNTARVYPFQVLLPARQTGLPRDSKAQAEQVRSVAAERIGNRIGQLPAALLTELDQALRIHLSL